MIPEEEVLLCYKCNKNEAKHMVWLDDDLIWVCDKCRLKWRGKVILYSYQYIKKKGL